MDIIGLSNPTQMSAPHRITRFCADGSATDELDEVQIEHSLDVYINEELTLRIVCSPNNLVDLVIGRLFTEGVIRSVDDVESIYLYAGATRARIYLNEPKPDLSQKGPQVALAAGTQTALATGPQVIPTTGGYNRLMNKYFEGEETLVKVKPIFWKRDWIFSLAKDFAQDSPMHRATSGSHSCYLAREDKILYCREDLGRHNAFDKVIGCALRDKVDLGKCIIFTSGRIPVDMVLKGIRSGVPILVSKAVPTDMTIELAKEFDLTLICSARPDSIKVFNQPLVGE